MIDVISIFGGQGKDGGAEAVHRVDLPMGAVVSVVGPTGSGKTTLINDLELFSDGSTPTGRRVLIDGKVPSPEYRDDPAKHPIALITQHTNFLSDLPVRDFLRIHAGIRGGSDDRCAELVGATLDFANQLTGEAVVPAARMTELSGGQTRSLLIADAVVIGNAPIILLDEIENAGIHRLKALDLLRQYYKVFVFVTHDPYSALMSDFRIVMRGGAMTRVVRSGEAERRLAERVREFDDVLSGLRERMRDGGDFGMDDLDRCAGLGAAKELAA